MRLKNRRAGKTKDEEGLTARILDELIEVANRIQAIPMLTYLPVEEEITSHSLLTDGEQVLFALCQTNGKVRCFSARPSFAEAIAEGTVCKLTGHWDPADHRAVAQAIRRYLVDEGYGVAP